MKKYYKKIDILLKEGGGGENAFRHYSRRTLSLKIVVVHDIF